jgi:nicotinamidase/pyrazinamidase
MKALVILDVQNDFMPGGSLEVPQGDQVVSVINRLQNCFGILIATQDWHPENHKSFASNHSDKKPFDRIELHGMEQILWPDHCVQGSDGAEFHPRLRTSGFDKVFRKGMNPEIDSYSGFYDNAHKISTGLSEYLKEKGISDLYFCGLAADICVYYSIKDAIREGFKATLVEDASRPLNTTDFRNIKTELKALGVHIVSSSDIIKDIEQYPAAG